MRGGDQEALTVMNSEGSLLVMEWRGVTSGWRALMSFTQSTLVSATVPRNTSCMHTHTQWSSMKSQGYMRYNSHHLWECSRQQRLFQYFGKGVLLRVVRDGEGGGGGWEGSGDRWSTVHIHVHLQSAYRCLFHSVNLS